MIALFKFSSTEFSEEVIAMNATSVCLAKGSVDTSGKANDMTSSVSTMFCVYHSRPSWSIVF